jgi:hypothetical protein
MMLDLLVTLSYSETATMYSRRRFYIPCDVFCQPTFGNILLSKLIAIQLYIGNRNKEFI